MVFQCEAQFQQFVHCSFRENIVRAQYIPTLWNHGTVFLIVNKYGKVGLYEPERFTLVHTYMIDLSLPMFPDMTKRMIHMAKRSQEIPEPKCQRTHLVVDAVFAQDLKSIFYLTTKGILQGYDIGEIETQKYGVELLPTKSYNRLKLGESPTELKNKGHLETHRVFGLPLFPTCLAYSSAESLPEKATSSSAVASAENSMLKYIKSSKILIGDCDGFVTVITIGDPRKPFGYRKIRGMLHRIKAEELTMLGLLTVYKAHNEPIKQLRFYPHRQLIISGSRDKKLSLFVKDLKNIVDPATISLPKGINCFAHSETLNMVATGSDDQMIRLFNQFILSTHQMELSGHRACVVGLEFLEVPFAIGPILLSLSTDVELRAWDPETYVCLQTVYISFPIKSTILCKTPEFAHCPIFVHQPEMKSESNSFEPLVSSIGKESKGKDVRNKPVNSAAAAASFESTMVRGQDGFLLILYCNSFSKLYIEKEPSYWPFDFDQLAAEFEFISSKYEKKLKRRQMSVSQNPKRVQLSPEEIYNLEGKLDSYVNSVMAIKRKVDNQLGKFVSLESKDKNPSLSGEISNRCFTLKNDERKDHSIKEGVTFKNLPIFFDFEPMNFGSKALPVTDMMRETGLSDVTCPEDLLTSKAKVCFSEESMRRMKSVTSIAKLDHYFQNDNKKNFSNDDDLFDQVTEGTVGITKNSENTKDYVQNLSKMIKFGQKSDQNLPNLSSEPIEASDSGLVNEEEFLIKSLEKLMEFTPEFLD